MFLPFSKFVFLSISTEFSSFYNLFHELKAKGSICDECKMRLAPCVHVYMCVCVLSEYVCVRVHVHVCVVVSVHTNVWVCVTML